MASKPLDTTAEHTKYGRMCRMVVELCRDMLWELLTSKIPIKELPEKVQRNLFKLRLDREQQECLGIGKGKDLPSNTDVDITILYQLLRNISKIKAPTNGWFDKNKGNVPGITDLKVGADIERIHLKRNILYGHAKEARLNEKTYKREVDDLRDDNILERYFHLGLTDRELQEVLGSSHQVSLSQRQIRRHLRRLSLKRRQPESPIEDIIRAVQVEISRSGRLSGIRIIHQRLRRNHNLAVKRQTVRDVMDVLMPGVLKERRRNRLSRRVYSSQGPNYLIHVDQYDKLARYGFYIHGAIDGYSRKLLWLKLGITNRKSSTVAGFFLEYALEITGLPQLIRVDGGTENTLMLKIQRF